MKNCAACGQPIPETQPDNVYRAARNIAKRLLGIPERAESWSNLRRASSYRDRPKFQPAVELLERLELVSLVDVRGGKEVRLTDRGVIFATPTD